MIEVPEISGHLFVGRSKEVLAQQDHGQLRRVDAGTLDDQRRDDPDLADGIKGKWLGYAPKIHLLWNVSWHPGDWLSEGQDFDLHEQQSVRWPCRMAAVPLDGRGALLHLGVNLRCSRPNEGTLKLRSRPESFPNPYVVDTGNFAAKSTRMTALEAYSRRGSVLIGSE